MIKKEIAKGLLELIQECNQNENYKLGTRADTSNKLDTRSKDVKAFLYDLLFDDDEEIESLLEELQNAIDVNVWEG